MNNILEYKNYIGSIEFSNEDMLFYGKVLGIKSLVSYEGKSASELVKNFHNSVDDYLQICEESNKKPEIAYKGSFNVRISPAIHKMASIYAIKNKISLNEFVEKSIEKNLAIVNN